MINNVANGGKEGRKMRAPAESKAKSAAPGPTPAGVVLLVDDNPHVLKALKRVLRGQAYKLLTASSAWEAITIMGKTRADVVVLDYWMPVLDGLRLARDLRDQYPETVRIMLTACSELRVVKEAANRGEIFRYLLKPWDEIELIKTIELAMSTARQNSPQREAAPVSEDLADFSNLLATAGRADSGPDPRAELEPEWVQSMIDLTKAVESRDPCIIGHSSRVAIMSSWVGERLGFDPERRRQLALGALMHDVGKVAVADSILFKSDRLSPIEMDAIRDHSMIGYQILKEQGATDIVSTIARHHHENFDGSGYPAQLAGDQIPLEARIVRLADSFDAMFHRRPYRAARPFPEIVAEIASLSGVNYDPDLTETFLQALQQRGHEMQG